MQQKFLKHARLAVVCVCSLFVMLLFSACAGVAGTTGTGGIGTITGSVVSVNASARSVTLNVNGQQVTVSGLTDQQVSVLQTQVNKVYTIQVQASQSGNNSYTINAGTEPTQNDNGTPEINVTPETNNDNNANTNTNNGVSQPGTISFIGKVQSYNAGTLVVTLPGNQSLSMSAVNGQTEFKNLVTPQIGQVVKVDALANPNGSFMASKVEAADLGDQQDTVKMNTVDFKGVTTQAVGSNGNLTFKVGNKSFSATIVATTQLKDYPNAQSIGANQNVKVEVLYNGNSGSVQKVQQNNG